METQINTTSSNALVSLRAYWKLVVDWQLCPWASGALDTMHVRVFVSSSSQLLRDIERALAQHDSDLPALWLAPNGPDAATWRSWTQSLLQSARLAIADFHPCSGDADTADTPAKLVSILRRSPDPMLQLVPHSEMAAMKDRKWLAPGTQLAALHGAIGPAQPRQQLAQDNFDRVHARGLDQLLVELSTIAESAWRLRQVR